MGEDGADEDRPQRSLDPDVLEVPAFPAQEPWVFRAEGRDAERRGRDGGHVGHGPIAGGNGTMRRIRLRTAAMCLVLLSPGVGSGYLQDRAATASSASAVKVVPVRTGLNGPCGFTFSPRGNIWYLERGTGEVRIIYRKTGGDHLFFTIGGVDGTGERRALGIALDPAFPTAPFVYVYVTRYWHGALSNQLVRIKQSGTHGIGLRVLMSTP